MFANATPLLTIGLLILSNVFMTFAWYGHLKFENKPLYLVIMVSWGIAFLNIVPRFRPTASATDTSMRRS